MSEDVTSKYVQGMPGDLSQRLMDVLCKPGSWRWWEDLEDWGEHHDWDECRAFFVVPEGAWYVFCRNGDGVARVVPGRAMSEVRMMGDAEFCCRPSVKWCSAVTAGFDRVLWDAGVIGAFKEAISWEDVDAEL